LTGVGVARARTVHRALDAVEPVDDSLSALELAAAPRGLKPGVEFAHLDIEINPSVGGIGAQASEEIGVRDAAISPFSLFSF